MTDIKSEFPSRPDLAIRGEVLLGKRDPRMMSEAEFRTSIELLYHGAAQEFAYSHLGEFDPSNTEGDGSSDYGSGIYMTDNNPQAINYSLERSSHRLTTPIVYSFLPYQARMLDVRESTDPEYNGVLPKPLVEEWAGYLENYVRDENNFSGYNEFLKDVFQGGIRSFLEPVKKALQENQDVYIRSGHDRHSSGIFQRTKNGLIDHIFRKFMLAQGYDGMIYKEGGEGEKKADLTGYVFYNPRVVDTWEGWQKRKQEST